MSDWILVTLDLYRRVLTRAFQLARRNALVPASALAYALLAAVAPLGLFSFGMLGGFLYTLLHAACFSSFLYLMEMMIRTSKVSFRDFLRSFTVYLGDVVGVLFLLYLFRLFAVPAILPLPDGWLILLCLQLAALVFLNAIPELIYLGHHGSFALLGTSYRFVLTNWVEWLPAALLPALLYFFLPRPTDATSVGLLLAAVPLLYFLMLVRGLLFLELDSTTYRSRRFRYRARD